MINDAEKDQPGEPNTEILKSRILTELGRFGRGEESAQYPSTTIPTSPRPTALNRTAAYADLCLREKDYPGAHQVLRIGSRQPSPTTPTSSFTLVYSYIGGRRPPPRPQLLHQNSNRWTRSIPPIISPHAALAEATGKDAEAENDIETVRTILRHHHGPIATSAPTSRPPRRKRQKSGLVPKPVAPSPAANQP